MLGTETPIRIVVVGDDSLTTEHLQTILDPRKFTVESVDPAPESIAAVRKSNPDLFVVDDSDGVAGLQSVCQTIRQYSCMPILVLSAYHSPNVIERVLDAGADDFLSKPVSGSVLMARLNTLARRALAERDAALAIARGEPVPEQSGGLLIY